MHIYKYIYVIYIWILTAVNVKQNFKKEQGGIYGRVFIKEKYG